MMSVEVREKLSSGQIAFVEALTGPGRREAAAAMGESVQSLIVFHLIDLAHARHATANRLGAAPTNYLAGLVDAGADRTAVQVDEDGVSINIRHPWIARAFRDVTITAKNKLLAIPLNAAAYGHSPREFSKVVLLKKGSGSGSGEKKEREPLDPTIPAYLLVRSVHQKQDRSILPTNGEMAGAAADGIRGYLRQALTAS